MSQTYKLAKLRWDCGQSEVVVGKVEFLKVTQVEKAVVRLEWPIEPAVAQVQVNYLTTFCIACDPIPGTTIYIYLPRLHLWIRNTIVVIRKYPLFNKFLPQLQQSRALDTEAMMLIGSIRSTLRMRDEERKKGKEERQKLCHFPHAEKLND